MLQVHQLTKRYGPFTVLDGVSFALNPGERMGVVGPNGAGKSTLMRLLAGVEHADSGSITRGTAERVGYLPQGLDARLHHTIEQEVMGAWAAARDAVETLAERMAADPEAIDAYGEALERFEALGGYGLAYRVEELLGVLGLTELDPHTPLADLSGGQRARVAMARVLLHEPDILLLDEPTNHLDVGALEWLEGYLTRCEGAMLIVSHDRAFLDRVATHILALEEGTARRYVGGYSAYLAERERERAAQLAAWKEQTAEEERIAAAIRRIEGQANHYEGISKDDFQRRKAKVLMQKATAQKSRLERDLEDTERIEKPERRYTLKLDFGTMPRGGQVVLQAEGVSFRYEGGPWLLHEVDLLAQHGERIALVGPNGAGKSTLFRLIVGDLHPLAGSLHLGAGIRPGYMPQQQASLPTDATPLSLIRAAHPMSETEARTLLHQFVFAADDVFKRVGALSYGERARLLLARLVVRGVNLLLLDEPLNHLDLPSREAFEAALDAFPGTVIAAAHDRAFVERFATSLWALRGGAVRVTPR
jgi:ATP-binding cassette subfamily F protein 3